MKHILNIWVFVSILLVAISCGKTDSKNEEDRDDNEIEYYPKTTFTLEDSVETLELTYLVWGCACPNWVVNDSILKYQSDGTLAMKSFYIEPAVDSLHLPDTVPYNGDIIRFTGRFYKELGYAKNHQKTEQDPGKSRVFRYTSFEIIKSNHHEAEIKPEINDSN